ncbi:M23 family metallopeptidase [Rubritalea marina]|uniref:M23 family metallopeptidase n=1 Tax=Rubritalea marina TaxID=361055 RepID=UPI00036F9717|nr:M23 family metallopeptidase [Rubritalea marina]
MPFILSRFVLALILGLICYAAYLTIDTRYEEQPPLQNFYNAQFVDVPLGIPFDQDTPNNGAQQFDPRFHFHSPFEAAQIPKATIVSETLGSEFGGFAYNAQAFMSPNSVRGGRHTGDDLNGIGGGDSDFGDPVYAFGDGLVIYAGTPSPGWGKTVILAHRAEDGSTLHSMYSHLSAIDVSTNTLVARGTTVGSVGSADGRYLAHLHLELRQTDGFSPQSGYSTHQFDRLDPSEVLSQWPQKPLAAVSPSILNIIQNTARKHAQLPKMDTQSALKLQELLDDSSN